MSLWSTLCLILSVCGARLVTAIRSALVKGRTSGDPVCAAAEETAKELKERICQIHQIQNQTANEGRTGISPARVMYSLCSPANELKFWLSHVSWSLYFDGEATSSTLTFSCVSWQCTNWSCGGVPLQPKAYAVNHSTAFGGRDTIKVLMALLDEEALTPLCKNRADLLGEDQPVLSGTEGTSVLMLFRLAIQYKLGFDFTLYFYYGSLCIF